MTTGNRLIVRGRQWPGGRLTDGADLHASYLDAICGRHFDEIVVRLYEVIPLAELTQLLTTKWLTRLRPGGRIILETTP